MHSLVSRVLPLVAVSFLLPLAQGCLAKEVVADDEAAIGLEDDGAAGVSLRIETDPVAGEVGALKLHWTAPADHDSTDFIMIHRVDAPDSEAIVWGYIGGLFQSAGLLEITLPTVVLTDPRPIEARYVRRTDNAKAKSNPVRAKSTYDVSVSFDNPELAGRVVTVGWQAPLYRGGDSVGMFRVGAPREQSLSWQSLWGQRSGSMRFTLPPRAQDPGPFEFRLIHAGSGQALAVSSAVVSPE